MHSSLDARSNSQGYRIVASVVLISIRRRFSGDYLRNSAVNIAFETTNLRLIVRSDELRVVVVRGRGYGLLRGVNGRHWGA